MMRTLIFLPGFMTAPGAYEELLAPVTASGWEVIVAQLHRPGLSALMGRNTVPGEAAAAAQLVTGHCVIGGHSRGGQVAWLAAGMAQGAGVLLIDPVDGHRRRPRGPVSTARPAGFECPCLVIGASCAAEPRHWAAFCAADPHSRRPPGRR